VQSQIEDLGGQIAYYEERARLVSGSA